MKKLFLKFSLLCVMSIVTLGASAQTTDYLCFTALDDSEVILKKEGTPTEVTMQYQINSGGWVTYDFSDPEKKTIKLSTGDKLYFRNASSSVTNFSIDTSNYYRFVMNGSSNSIAASGNVMSLVDQSCTTKTIPNAYCFLNLFKGCKIMMTAPELPATTLKEGCYAHMFESCTSMTTAPELPATTLAEGCYNNMFCLCLSLTTAPELPATTLAPYCYVEMFYKADNLTTAPELPATTLVEGCYTFMFAANKVNDVKVAFSDWNSGSSTGYWIYGESGTFVCPSGLSNEIDDNHIPTTDWTVKNTYDLTISSLGWNSLYVNLPLSIPSGADVYYASSSSVGTVTLTKIAAGTKIAARTGVLVKGTPGTTVQFPVASEAGTTFPGNLFEGTSVDKQCAANSVYVLSDVHTTGEPKFLSYTGTTLGAHKAYLSKSVVSSFVKGISFLFEDGTDTGIKVASENENTGKDLYNLSGVRVNDNYKGVVIRNGKKIFNK